MDEPCVNGEDTHGGFLQHLVTGIAKGEAVVFFAVGQDAFSVITHVHHC